jgi:beta-lactamase class D
MYGQPEHHLAPKKASSQQPQALYALRALYGMHWNNPHPTQYGLISAVACVIVFGTFLVICSSNVAVAQHTAAAHPDVTVHAEWQHFFDSAHVQGCLLLYDLKASRYHAYNLERCKTAFLPASTFKIPNSLIGLETGVIHDADFVIKWDSVRREIESWNKDHTLRSAIAVSCVPYYQELARRVGSVRMKAWLDSLRYGNADIRMAIDNFWLSGWLRITCFEQIDFLRRLHQEALPTSKRSMHIVKDIIRLDSTAQYVLRGKTGWAGTQNAGWFVGWLEARDNTYFFACNLDLPRLNPNLAARRALVEQVLRLLKVM